MPQSRPLPAVLSVYAAALLHGLTVVSFPASAAALKAHGGLSDAQYGAVFIPQMLATLAGSLIAGRLGARAASGGVLAASLACAAFAETLLALVPNGGGFPAALAAAACTGLGFGLAAAPLNALPRRLFPERADAALVALHTLLAFGFAAGPAIVSAAAAAALWVLLPGGVALAASLNAVCALAFAPRATASDPSSSTQEMPGSSSRLAPVFIAIAVLYALAEGTFANWAVLFLREERGLAETQAALALSTFWLALATGRLGVSLLLGRVAAQPIWRLLPVLMATAFLGLPQVRGPATGVLWFALAGLGCSAFFPLTVSLAASHFAGGAPRAASLLTAALMIGVGLGSFAIGPLRATATLASVYAASAAYPLCALLLCAWASTRRPALAVRE